MLKYTVKRILYFIPAVLVISVITFMLIRAVPGDMADALIRSQTDELSLRDAPGLYEKKYREKARELGTDLPAFYVEISSCAYPRSLAYEWNPVKKEVITNLIRQTGESSKAYSWYSHLEFYDRIAGKYGKTYPDAQERIDLERGLHRLLHTHDKAEIQSVLNEMKAIALSPSAEGNYVRSKLEELRAEFESLYTSPQIWKNYIPTLRFHSQCAFGVWLMGNGSTHRGILRGDFGSSVINGKPVKQSLSEKIGLTLGLSLLSILLAFIIALPLGILSFLYHGSIAEKIITGFLFMLFTLPSFWVASLCIMWLTGGDGLNWFAPYGTGKVTPDMDIFEIIRLKWTHFALPLFAWTYGGLAFISKQMQTSLLQHADREYITAAIARGLSFRRVLFGHLLPNSLRPLITMAANILPALMGGSVVLETLFSLPGMGEWAYRAYLMRDFPVIMAVVFWSSVLTLTGHLISDILLAWSDPKIKFTQA
jgi:peptide/nickel transport system permease protein